MTLPERFVVVIEGTVSRVRSRAIIVPNALPHLLARLFGGDDVRDEHVRAFGLKLTIEEDSDGGEEVPDPPRRPAGMRDS